MPSKKVKKIEGKRTALTVRDLKALLEMIADDDTIVQIEANMDDNDAGFVEKNGDKVIIRRATNG